VTRCGAALAVVCVLASCGGESAADRGAREWCEGLQADGLLFEPMSACIAEYHEMQREKSP
jgi:hypothetical protein